MPNPPQYNVGEHNWVCNNGISILPGNQGLTITASREGDYLNGVSTEDIVHIQNYILGQPPLTQTPYNPFRIIAADVNLSGTVSILDVILIRSVILGNPPAWASGSYRFIPRFYFIGPSSGFCQSFYANPFTAVFNPGNIGYPQYSNGVIAFSTNLSNPLLPWFDFWSVKMGNFTGNTDDLISDPHVEMRAQTTIFSRAGTSEHTLSAHPRITIGSKDLNDLGGIQLGIELPSTVKSIRLTSIQLPDFNEDNYSIKQRADGSYELRVSWAKWDQQWKPYIDTRDGFTEFFTLDLEMSTNQEKLTDLISLSPSVLASELYSSEGEILDRAFMISHDKNNQTNGGAITATSTVFAGQLMVKISGINPGNLSAELTDMRGVSVLKRSAQVDSFSRDTEISLPVSSLPKGLYILRLVNGGQSRSIKVVL